MSTCNIYILTNVDAALMKGGRKANVGVNTPYLLKLFVKQRITEVAIRQLRVDLLWSAVSLHSRLVVPVRVRSGGTNL